MSQSFWNRFDISNELKGTKEELTNTRVMIVGSGGLGNDLSLIHI